MYTNKYRINKEENGVDRSSPLIMKNNAVGSPVGTV